MFKLSDLYSKIILKPLPTDCGITCEILDGKMAKLNRLLTDSVSCFSYTLVLSGNQTVLYNDKQTFLTKNDIFIFTPGMMIRTMDVSEDYVALCLMGDESTTYEIPYARNVISASYFPSVAYSENKLSLSDCEANWLERRMKEILQYIESDHQFKNECLKSLYSLFILDLLYVEKRFKNDSGLNGHTIDLFLKFLKLLSTHFTIHHDISFYSSKLAVTSIYLSRIVKHLSGQTVKDHIDRLLVMEASYLLISTDLPISNITERLHFATPASFSKFFSKYKGMSPREYRKSRHIS